MTDEKIIDKEDIYIMMMDLDYEVKTRLHCWLVKNHKKILDDFVKSDEQLEKIFKRKGNKLIKYIILFTATKNKHKYLTSKDILKQIKKEFPDYPIEEEDVERETNKIYKNKKILKKFGLKNVNVKTQIITKNKKEKKELHKLIKNRLPKYKKE